MEGPLEKARDRFVEQFRQFESSLNGQRDHRIHAFRQSAIERFKEIGFPGRKDEDWKYSPLAQIVKPSYTLPVVPEIEPEDITAFDMEGLDAYRLVFVNGEFRPGLSSKDEIPGWLKYGNIGEIGAGEQIWKQLEKEYKQITGQEATVFETLNGAFARRGFYLSIPAGKRLEKPLHFIYISTGVSGPVIINPQRFIHAGRSSDADIIDSYYRFGSDEDSALVNSVHRIHLDANAGLRHYKLQNESRESFLVNNTAVQQEKDSRYTSFSIDSGGQWVRNNLSALHLGENVETNYWGAYLTTGEQHYDNQTLIDHAVPHCESNELYKGILADRSTAVFNGKVIVRQDAQKTNAFQQNNALVLSPGATMNSKPQLEIFADDVRCSHGATTGQMDERALFYMQTRGLSRQEARKMLQYAFIKEVLDKMEIEPVRKLTESWFESKLQ